MTPKIKTTLLTAFFLVGLLTGLQAQDKYEYAIVSADNFKVIVTKHTKEKFSIDKGVVDFDAAVIIKVEEMCKEGWEVFNTAPAFTSGGADTHHIFYLRKKMKE